MPMFNRLLLFAALFAAAPPAAAGDYNYQSILIGERAAGMGGAYTALSEGPEGSYYNPAGLVFSEGNTLSVAANAYSLSRGEVAGGLRVGDSRADLSQDNFQSIPTTASYLIRFSFPWEKTGEPGRKTTAAEGEAQADPEPDWRDRPNAASVSVFIIDQFRFDGKMTLGGGNTSGAIFRQTDDQTLLLGPSYARRLNANWSAGLSLYYLLRMLSQSSFVQVQNGGDFGQGFLRETFTAGGLILQGGVRANFLDHYSAGIKVASPTLPLYGSGDYYDNVLVETGGDPPQRSGSDLKDLAATAKRPLEIALGLARQRRGHHALAADLHLYLPQEYAIFEGYSQNIDQQFIANFNLGGEYYFWKGLPLRLGFFSNYSSADPPRPDRGSDLQLDAYGVSGSIGLEKEHSTVNVGFVLQFGDGQARASDNTVVDYRYDTYSIFLAGSYRF